MAERIYTMGEQGQLEPLEEQPFKAEDDLQKLIAEHPELLDGEQMRPDDPRRWMLITREKGISDTSGTSARWATDHLIIDQDAVPTLAEVKRGSNTEIRRTVVGQLLEYAAHAAQTWSAEELRQTFEESANARGIDPGDQLRILLQTDDEPDADDFWVKVATNLAARRLRLLFVADEIPDELARVTEFLNEQMPNIEVLAVEIKQFQGASAQALVPRVIGRTAALPTPSSTGPRRKLNFNSFLEEFASDEEGSVATRLLKTAQDSGASLGWGISGVSVRMKCSVWKYEFVSVAWLFPPTVSSGWAGLRCVSFGADVLNYTNPAPEGKLRTLLEHWVNQFSSDDFIEDHAPSLRGKARIIDYGTAAAHIDLLVERLTKVLGELKAL